MTPRPSQSWPPVLLLVVTLLLSLTMPTTEQQPTPQITLQKNCTENCGGVSIPYPFGIEPGCSLPGFEVVCNKTFDPPRPFVAGLLKWPIGGYYSTNKANQAGTIGAFDYADNFTTDSNATQSPMELVDVSVGVGEARVYGAFSFNCEVNQTYRSFLKQALELSAIDSPFHIDIGRNVLIGIGSNANSQLTSSIGGTTSAGITSCVSRPMFSDRAARDGAACTGQGCCEAAITQAQHQVQLVVVVDSASFNRPWDSENCSFGMLVEKDQYNYTSQDVYGDKAYFAKKFPRGFPLVVDFIIRNGSCPAEGQPRPQGYACLSGNSSCINPTDSWRSGYLCRCWDGYEGNPYVPTGCQDINECMGKNNCTGDHQTCINTLGSYYCGCKRGTRPDGQTCAEIFPLPAKVAVGAIGGLFVIALLALLIILRKEKRKMREFFIKNGGPTLEKAKMIKIYKREDLKPILKSSNLIGKGGFGEVYKGLLDNQLVAVKKPINGTHNEQFANEVNIQSRVIHKNIVRLIGCCLEVDIPMLVYEFLPKGSLDEILHGSSRVPLDLERRLNIAAESAEGLAYMHSKTTSKILHGDVKPANILLDDSFVPKISDFGISRLIAIDKQHTNNVIGDRSYMDPEYLRTGLLSDKSDVYSFGIVLLELISRKKATYSDNSSLVKNFLDAHKMQKGATELFDDEIAAPKDLELLDSLVAIAVECLNLDVEQRPEMKVVADRLVMLKSVASHVTVN